ncbi:hypothetical protein SAMN04487977_101454 [Treponema bryantii]|uniref:Sigma-70, region 4 n=1 Tax=Treponema bryantii TaxID=163 RepID=A0A1H9AT36_9SPIR|nr:hypothetical protein [Treponema bryantii]SEP79691.1 hypothetical protein SAMN04487977_101454 [Treponema bryantii]
MSATVRKINVWFKTATRADVNDLLEKIVLSDRQTRIFEMFYLKRQNIGFIADTLGFSERVICEELYLIRDKIERAIQTA